VQKAAFEVAGGEDGAGSTILPSATCHSDRLAEGSMTMPLSRSPGLQRRRIGWRDERFARSGRGKASQRPSRGRE